jgi:hypothetical protein
MVDWEHEIQAYMPEFGKSHDKLWRPPSARALTAIKISE